MNILNIFEKELQTNLIWDNNTRLMNKLDEYIKYF